MPNKNFIPVHQLMSCLGRHVAFTIWWIFHLVFLLNVYICANLYMYFDSKKNLMELTDLSLVQHKLNTVLPMPSKKTSRSYHRTVDLKNYGLDVEMNSTC